VQSLAKPQDLIDWWRPFEDDSERRVARTKLRAIHRTIRIRFRDLETPRDLDTELEAAETGTPAEQDWRDTVRDVECEAVKRALLNPDAFTSESIDDWSGRRDADKFDGSLYLTPDEWVAIGVTPPAGDEDAGKAFTVDQTPAYAVGGYYDVPHYGGTLGWNV
jgi:hypothetical protein